MSITRKYLICALLAVALAPLCIVGVLGVIIFGLLLSIVLEMKILAELFQSGLNEEVIRRDLV